MNSARLLIVEDDAILAVDLQDMLTQLGYRVVGLCATGASALELARAHLPDIVLMDINLRGEMNGIQAARLIHDQLDIPVLFLTAYTDDATLRQAMSTEAFAYLSKPVRERELHASLEMALYKSTAEKRLRHLHQVLRALRDVNQLITRERDAQRMVEEACRIILRTRGYRCVWIGQVTGGMLNPMAWEGEDRGVILHILRTASPGQGARLPGTVASRTAEVVVCHDMLADERYAPWRSEIQGAQFRSTIAVPMRYEQGLLGVLIVYSDQTNYFDAEEIDLLKELANDIAFGMHTIEEDAKHRQAEAALRRSEAKFRAVIENLHDGILFQDAVGTITYRSPSFNRISGYSDEERLGHSVFETIHPQDLPGLQRFLVQVIQHPETHLGMEFRIRHKDGSWRWLETTAQNLLHISDIQEIVTASRDITERKQAERERLQSQEQLQAIVQNANDGIITLDERQRVVFWNGAAERIFGFAAAEMMGEPLTRLVPLGLRGLESEGTQRFFERGALGPSGQTIEVEAVDKEGRLFPLEISFAGWKTEAGHFVTGFIRDISERKQRENELQAIATLSSAMRIARDRRGMVAVIVEQIVGLLKVEAVTVELIDLPSGDAIVEAAYGAWESVLGARQKTVGFNAIVDRILAPYGTLDLESDPSLAYPQWVRGGALRSAGVPLVAHEDLIGYIWVGRNTALTPGEVRLLHAIADITANALHRAILHEQALKSAAELGRAYDSTLEGLARVLELRDRETEGHSQRVTELTLHLARAFALDEDAQIQAYRGALLHDIGKLGIPDSILNKNGPLSEVEWGVMRCHPQYAYDLLSPIEHLRPALDIPFYHHEKWDGSGYPFGLRGAEIPLEARIFAIVDVWDALTSDRPYRPAWSREKTLEYIRGLDGTHFDPAVVQEFLKLMQG